MDLPFHSESAGIAMWNTQGNNRHPSTWSECHLPLALSLWHHHMPYGQISSTCFPQNDIVSFTHCIVVQPSKQIVFLNFVCFYQPMETHFHFCPHYSLNQYLCLTFIFWNRHFNICEKRALVDNFTAISLSLCTTSLITFLNDKVNKINWSIKLLRTFSIMLCYNFDQMFHCFSLWMFTS